MLNKILGATLCLLLSQQVALAQDGELTTVSDPEASPVLDSTAEQGSEVDTTEDMQEEGEQEEGEQGEGEEQAGLVMDSPLPISESCLYKSFTYGNYTGDWTDFDQMEDIKAMVTSDLIPHALTACLDEEEVLVSLQITYAKEDGTNQVVVPKAGPELVPGLETCTEMLFEGRQTAEWVRIFKDDEEKRIPGFGVVFNSTDLWKFGQPSVDGFNVELEPDQHFIGFFGKMSDVHMTELGVIIQNFTCTEEKAQAMLLEQQLLEESLRANQGDVDDDGSSTVTIVVIVVIVVILIIIAIIVLIILKKSKKNQDINKVTVLKGQGQPGGIPESSSSLPNVETEDDNRQTLESKRSDRAFKEV